MQNKNLQKYVLKECKNYYHFLKKKGKLLEIAI